MAMDRTAEALTAAATPSDLGQPGSTVDSESALQGERSVDVDRMVDADHARAQGIDATAVGDRPGQLPPPGPWGRLWRRRMPGRRPPDQDDDGGRKR